MTTAAVPPLEMTEALETPLTSLVETDSLNAMLTQVGDELADIQPRIDELAQLIEDLNTLKTRKQKLIALKLSLESILNQQAIAVETPVSAMPTSYAATPRPNGYATAQPAGRFDDFQLKSFYPDRAFAETEPLLPRKESLNYELFRAIVYHGGKATTEQVRQYLIDHDVRYPTTGQSFTEIGLSQVSSRINYLMRKGIVRSLGGGMFASNYGWHEGN